MVKRSRIWLRKALMSVIANECLFMFSSFFVIGVLTMGPLTWHREAVDMFERFVLVPWGLVLCALRLQRNSHLADMPARRDLDVLAVLALWVIVPFGIRFGLTFNNVGSWQGFLAAYFGIYAMTSEEPREKRDQMLDLAGALFAAMSVALGVLAMMSAAAATEYGAGIGEYGFGVAKDGMLRIGIHHNSTGMIAMLSALMCLAGVCRRKHKLTRLLHLLGAVLMTLVVVLSQSRTSRYSLLAAFALGCYGLVACRAKIGRAALRHGAGLLAGVMVFVGGYIAASAVTDAALEHYAYTRAGLRSEAGVELIAQAVADEDAQKTKDVKVHQARGVGDASFTGRTLIWKNLFRIWKENPKHFLIGQGVGRTGSRVVEGTVLEKDGAATMHNTYLQFTADFGLIGFMLLCAFLALLVKPCLRVFYSDKAQPGDKVLCMVVAACLITGLMESNTFGSMNYCNALLLFALALIMGRSRDIESLVQSNTSVL